MDSGNCDFFISSAGAESLANSAQALGVSNSSYSTSQSDAHSTYHSAEFLAQSNHGMTYQGGINGGWTHPTTGNPLTAAQYMQVSADLRAQTNRYHGGADRGHATAQYTAQLAANGIRNSQAMIESINRQPCNSTPYNQPYQEQVQIHTYNESMRRHSSLKNQVENFSNQLKNAPGGFSYEAEKTRKELCDQLNKVRNEMWDIEFKYPSFRR
jgi:hypothetical protein